MIQAIRCVLQRLGSVVERLAREIASEEVGEPTSHRRTRRPARDVQTAVTIICDARQVSAQARLLQIFAEGLHIGCAELLQVGQTVRCALTSRSAEVALRLTVTSRRKAADGYRYTLRTQRGRMPLRTTDAPARAFPSRGHAA